VFLTNTLEPIEPQKNFLLPAITAEAEAAQAVKEKPVLVIVGNPPYSSTSRNKGSWITSAIEKYKIVDGKPFGERKHWLHDDYVKFLRFAQMKMDQTENGIVAVITNNSFLDNPSFRGMRQSLMTTFDQLIVLDLNGSVRRREQRPVGSADENVFDIEQGVAISIFIKFRGSEKQIKHTSLWGTRIEKYSSLARGDAGIFDWSSVAPRSPLYLLRPFSGEHLEKAYNDFVSIRNIWENTVSGIVTARDNLSIGFTKSELETKISNFVEGRGDFSEIGNTRGWNSDNVKIDLSQDQTWKKI
jgi:predicted helicase